MMTCMITAYANIDTAIAATRQGVDFFLPKPFLPDDLLGVVETLARHKRARTEADRLRHEHEASLLALAEEKTQTHSLVSSLRDAVLVVNRDGDVVLANRAMTALLDTAEEEVLRRPAAELLQEGPLAPLASADRPPQRPDHRPAQHRRADLHDQHRHLQGRRRRGAGPHPHPLGHLPGAAPGHGEGTLHPHHGPRAEVPPGSGARHRSRWPPTRAWATTSRATCPCCAGPRDRIDNLVQLIGDLLSLSRSEQARGTGRTRAAGDRARRTCGPWPPGRKAGRPEHLPRRGDRTRPAPVSGPRRRPRPHLDQSGRQRRQVQPRRRQCLRCGPVTTGSGCGSTSKTPASA